MVTIKALIAAAMLGVFSLRVQSMTKSFTDQIIPEVFTYQMILLTSEENPLCSCLTRCRPEANCSAISVGTSETGSLDSFNCYLSKEPTYVLTQIKVDESGFKTVIRDFCQYDHFSAPPVKGTFFLSTCIRSFREARIECLKLGGTLASLTDDEFDYVEAALEKGGEFQRGSRLPKKIFVDIIFDDSLGSYVWGNTNTLPTEKGSFPWNAYQPSEFAPGFCGRFVLKTDQYVLNTFKCTDQLPFLCRKI